MPKKRWKIGLVSPFLPERDGIAIYSNNLLKGLGESRSHCITIGRKGDDADYTLDFKSLKLKEHLESIIRKESLDALHIQYVASLFSRRFLNYNLLRVFGLSIPIIVTLHEVHYSNNGFKNSVLKAIEKKIVQKASTIIVHTPAQKRHLCQVYFSSGRSKDDSEMGRGYKYKDGSADNCADNCVDNGEGKIHVICHGAWKRSIKRAAPIKSLLCFGMLSIAKGIPDLIKAMELLPGYKLTIAGSFVDDRAKAQILGALKIASKHNHAGNAPTNNHKNTPNNLPNNVSNSTPDNPPDNSPNNIVTDFQWIDEHKKERYCRSSGIIVLPYHWAPYQSGILHNAVEWSLPVVVTDVGALGEMVKQFGFGEVIPPKSPEAIAGAVRNVFKYYRKYQKNLQAYRDLADWPVVASEHCKLYLKVIDNQ